MYKVDDDFSFSLRKLAESYPKKDFNDDNVETFQRYIDFCNPIHKDLIAVYIYYHYCKDGTLFGTAEVSDYVFETFEVLNVFEIITFIKWLYHIYEVGNMVILSDTIRILIRLFIGTMTIHDVINEEKDPCFEPFIYRYLEYLRSGISFDDLYYMMMYDWKNFRNHSNDGTNIQSYEDGRRKVKSLYCALYIYTNN